MVQGPVETANRADRPFAAAREVRERPPVSGKAFLRQEEFLEQRGLSSAPRSLSIGMPLAVGAPLDIGDAERGDSLAAASSPYLLGARQKETLAGEAPPEVAAIVWRPLGPNGIPRGQTYGSGPGSTTTVAGRVAAIAVDPGDPAHILIGAAAGGVWQTRDGGRTWTPRTDDQPTLSIGALAFDPSHPATVYAGTGEANSAYYHLGQGILASHDGGTTWALIARQVFADIGFYRIVVDPRDGRRLFVATTGGAAVSPDGGTRWGLLYPGETWDVSLAYPGDEPEILLATPDGLLVWTGGGNLDRIPIPFPWLPGAPQRMAVTHVPSDPGQAFVFAADDRRAYLWHRAAADGPFRAVALSAFPIPPYVDDILDVDQAFYDWYVAVPPGSADVVYLGAKELVKGERTGATWQWSDISSREEHGDSIHPDQHAMAFDPRNPSIVYAGNDGGIFRSPDGGASWQSLNAGLAISEVEYLAQRPDEPDWLLAGLQDNGTVRRQGEEGWTQVALGDGGDCGTDLDTPDVCYHSYYGMSLERSSSRGDRDSWDWVTPPNAGRDQFKQLFYPPVEVNGQVVVKAGEVVCASADGGDTWIRVPLPPTPQGPSVASALAIPTPERILVGTVRGDVFRIDRHPQWGANPTLLTRPGDGWISDLLVDPALPHRYWATYSNPGAVFRSDDEGVSWTDVTAGLPDIPVNAVVNDAADPDRIWVACDVGVFESRDSGQTWSVYGTGLPNVLAEDLLFYAPGRLLRVGTRSRGVWEATVG